MSPWVGFSLSTSKSSSGSINYENMCQVIVNSAECKIQAAVIVRHVNVWVYLQVVVRIMGCGCVAVSGQCVASHASVVRC